MQDVPLVQQGLWKQMTTFRLGLRALPEEGIHACYWKTGQKPLVRVTGPRGNLLLCLVKWTCDQIAF